MNKILIAVDMSGSVLMDQARRVTADFIGKLCPNTEIDMAMFNYNSCEFVDMKDFFGGKLLGEGGASGTAILRWEAYERDYDHLYIITDGYMDKHDLEETDTVSVVIYE